MVSTMNNILLGTSGWSYREWIGSFYKKREKSMLKAHSKVFKTVEINSTFYAYPSKGTVMGWVKYSPEDYVFSAKLPKVITHEKLLNLKEGVEEDLIRFCDLVRPISLNGKLGSLLIQLPPKYRFDPDHLERFFQILPGEFKFAVEFRHLSWMRRDTWRLLEEYGVAYTIVDEPLLPPEVQVTADFAYFRWHGHGVRPWFNYRYSVEELKPWVPKVNNVAAKVKKVYGYFNNHFHGYAVENCLQVLEMMGFLTAEQAVAKTNVEGFFKKKTTVKKPTLEAFMEHKEMTFEDLINDFIDKPRLKRAQSIKDEEVIIQEVSDDQVKALIRGYHIVIDLANHVILHDCADWSRVLLSKTFCKHLVRMLLSLNRQKASIILKQIYANKEDWHFKAYAE
ncbi:MAG: DUF72 domain-containing protein [Candidatus Bathyarchaeota archaeon]|nr:DUF72 domain-containing protein [Candidatus Bathyarchaeota archaeon]